MPTMKAHYLLKKNIDALLTARGLKRKALASWCNRSESWLSKIFTSEDRNLPLKYLDRIADFFGLATYQLFAPGISDLTERRSGQDRRSGRERRVSRVEEMRAPVMPQAELERLMRALPPEKYRLFSERVKAALVLGEPLRDDTTPHDHQPEVERRRGRETRTRRRRASS